MERPSESETVGVFEHGPLRLVLKFAERGFNAEREPYWAYSWSIDYRAPNGEWFWIMDGGLGETSPLGSEGGISVQGAMIALVNHFLSVRDYREARFELARIRVAFLIDRHEDLKAMLEELKRPGQVVERLKVSV